MSKLPSLENFKDRNVSEDSAYYMVDIEKYAETPMEKFKQAVDRTFKLELFVGLWVVLREMFKFNIHTVQYPAEKLPIGPRYRAVHEMQRLWESGTERCIGCGLCEIDQDPERQVVQRFGRLAETRPEAR